MPAHAAKSPAHPAAEAALWVLWRLAAPLAGVFAAAGLLYRAAASHAN